MCKKCCVCGRSIEKGELYYTVGDNKYTCINDVCFNTYYWTTLTSRIAADKNHHYAIINHEVYEIGNSYDYPKGFDGKHWKIIFKDGITVETDSLWYRGKLPENLFDNIRDNAFLGKK